MILDPGSISAGTLALLEGAHCRLIVADAALSLDALGGQTLGPDDLQRSVDELIPDAGAEKVDTVLCWDLLNYLSPPLLAAFARRLVAIMAPNGLVHAYIHTARTTMPKRPQRYTAHGTDRVLCLDSDEAERTAPRYSAWGLEKHGFCLRVERSVLLRSGMQEYLLRAGPERTGDRSNAAPKAPAG